VALLRGVNVGAAKRVEMAKLRALVSELGYTEVSTLLNSGNVVFTAVRAGSPRAGGRDAASRIEKAISENLGFSCRVIVITSSELDTAVAENPLLENMDNPSRMMVAVTADPADLSRLAPLLKEDWGGNALAVGSRAAYLWCPDGILASKLAAEVQRILGDGVTIRNWATMRKLRAMAGTQGPVAAARRRPRGAPGTARAPA